jgi:hypothetical protein
LTQRIEDGGWKTGGKERIEGRHFGKWEKKKLRHSGKVERNEEIKHEN